MQTTFDFPELLRLIEDRSAALRAAAASAPDFEAPVPTCPDWTLRELVRHVGGAQRRQAGIVTAGPDAGKPGQTWQDLAEAAPTGREALIAWAAEGTRLLVDTLREAGPDRGCWAFWQTAQTPLTTGAVARHQIYEAGIHAYDAQLAAGDARLAAGDGQPLPDEIALDAVDEFLFTVGSTSLPWPYKPAAMDVRATEGAFWRMTLDTAGVQVSRSAEAPAVPAEFIVEGTAGDLALVLYGRLPVEHLKLEGDRTAWDLLAEWDPNDPATMPAPGNV